MNEHHDMFMLGGIGAAIHWFEQFTILISAPLLTIGLGISLVDLLTGGHLLEDTPWLAFVWAVGQAVGIEGQATGAMFNVRRNFSAKRYPFAALYFILALALGYVAFLAAQAFILHESSGFGISAALRLIGIDDVSWALQRAGMAVVLVLLAPLLRYVPKKATLEDEKAELHRQLELNPLRQALDAQNIDRVKGAAGRLFNRQPQQPTMGAPAPVTVPFTQANSDSTDTHASPDQDQFSGAYITARNGYLTAVGGNAKRSVRTRRKRAPRGSLNWEEMARDAWQTGMSIDGLMLAVNDQLEEGQPGMKRTAAAHWRAVFQAEERERQKQQLRA